MHNTLTRALAALLAAAVAGGCSSLDRDPKSFAADRDWNVGRAVDAYGYTQPYAIDREDDQRDRYRYANSKTGCRWSFLVDRSSRVVESWRYESDAKLCSDKVNWRGPW